MGDVVTLRRRLVRAWGALVCLIGIGFTPRSALAGGLSYSVVEGCPAQTEFEQQIVDVCDLSTLALKLQITRNATEFQSELQLDPDSSSPPPPERHTSTDCQTLVDLAAFTARRACAPRPEPAAPVSRPVSSAAPSEPRASVSRSAVASPSPMSEEQSRLQQPLFQQPLFQQPWVSAGLLADSGTSRALNAGTSLSLGGELGGQSVAFGFQAWLPRTIRVSLEPGHDTDMQLRRGSLQLEDCLLTDTRTGLGPNRWGIGACANVGYQIAATLLSAGTKGWDYRSWVSVGASLRGMYKISERVLLEGRLGGIANLAPPPVPAEPFGVVYRFGSFAAVGGIRTVWVFESIPRQAAGSGGPIAFERGNPTAFKSLNNQETW